MPSISVPDGSHGRRVRRTVQAVEAPAWIDFPGAAQVIRIRRTRTVNKRGGGKKKTTEVVYLICSLPVDQARPEQIAAWTRGHWDIANRLHWVRDMVTGEDRHQLRTRNGPLISAALRNPATRPHPPRPRTPHTHRRRHQSHGPTPPTSHQTTHPTTPLNQPCRPPATSTENLRVTARVVSRRPASRILHPRSRAGTMDPGADASWQDPAPAESGRCIDSQA